MQTGPCPHRQHHGHGALLGPSQPTIYTPGHPYAPLRPPITPGWGCAVQQGRCRECGGWRLLIHTGPEFSQCLGRGSQHPASQVTAPSTAHCGRYTGSTGDTDTGGSGDTQLQIQGAHWGYRYRLINCNGGCRDHLPLLLQTRRNTLLFTFYLFRK